MSVHSTAEAGFGTGNNLYDRARPSYQSFALAYIRNTLKGASPINIAEIGAGTGIFTRALLSHADWSSEINEIKAVEPSAGMREVFSKTVVDERVEIKDGTFDNTNIEDHWADLVVIAQAFHWCPDYDSASAEFARILKPNGIVVFIWNLEDRDGARWVANLRERIEQHEEGTPQFRLDLWRQTFDTATYQRLFQPPVEKVWPYTLPATLDIAVDRASSKSYIVVLPEGDRMQVQRDVRDIVEKGEGKVWISESEGIFEYPYKCYVIVAEKK